MTQGLGVLRQQTKQFIDENPTAISLVRGVKVPDGAGGNTFTTVDLLPQTMRLIEQQENSTVERQTVGGKVVRPMLNLFCEYDADIQRGDQFTWQGMTVQVVWITDTGYAKTAEVASL